MQLQFERPEQDSSVHCKASHNYYSLTSVILSSHYIMASFPGFIAFRRTKAWDPFTCDGHQLALNWTKSTTAPTHQDPPASDYTKQQP